MKKSALVLILITSLMIPTYKVQAAPTFEEMGEAYLGNSGVFWQVYEWCTEYFMAVAALLMSGALLSFWLKTYSK